MPSVTGDDDGAGYGVKGSSAAGSGVVGDGPAWAGVVATSVTGSGVSAFSDSGAGVSSVSNAGPGVVGESVNGVGVRARSDYGDALVASSGGAVGVRAASTVDNAVFAETHADDHASVYGFTRANGGTAVAGLAQCADGVGVFGAATSKGSGLFGQATAGGAGVTAVGYTGVVAQGGQGAGVEAWSLADDGVSGVATDRLASGVIGTNPTAGASGVAGMSVAGTGVYAESNTGAGVVAYSQSGIGVRATAAGGDPAVVAQGRGIGVRASGGVGAQITGSTLGAQIIGSETGATITGKEVGLGVEGDVYGASIKGKAIGLSAGSDQIAILASVYKGTAVLAATTEKSTIVGTVLQLGAAIHGKAGNPKAPSTYAGLFEGDVTVNGTLRKSSDHFVIDHPLDPAGKFLEHSVVESDEMKNVYDGVVTLDRRGSAVVRLSPWFEALNTRFRYQLTPIGGPAPNLHVRPNSRTVASRSAAARRGSKCRGRSPVCAATPGRSLIRCASSGAKCARSADDIFTRGCSAPRPMLGSSSPPTQFPTSIRCGPRSRCRQHRRRRSPRPDDGGSFELPSRSRRGRLRLSPRCPTELAFRSRRADARWYDGGQVRRPRG
jgi:hypothetical protein